MIFSVIISINLNSLSYVVQISLETRYFFAFNDTGLKKKNVSELDKQPLVFQKKFFGSIFNGES